MESWAEGIAVVHDGVAGGLKWVCSEDKKRTIAKGWKHEWTGVGSRSSGQWALLGHVNVCEQPIIWRRVL